MDSKGSLVDTYIRIYPSNKLLDYLKNITIDSNVPINIAKLVKGKNYEPKLESVIPDVKTAQVHFTSKDIENLNKIKAIVKDESNENEEQEIVIGGIDQDSRDKETKNEDLENSDPNDNDNPNKKTIDKIKIDKEDTKIKDELHLITSDIDWLYIYLQKQRNIGDNSVPYLHVLLEGAHIETPENAVIKRNPILEARCVKLRAQQEARDYRKMTKSVDNVRMRFPEDSISYQLKQMNRQLIAIGQFIISIFAGFLFGFRGVEWMVGNLDFGFRLLLGVMCALIIALAEIYFLAKKLNEELNIPETVQLGGPPKFADQPNHHHDYLPKVQSKTKDFDKEHQD